MNMLTMRVAVFTQPLAFSMAGVFGLKKVGKRIKDCFRPAHLRSPYGGHNAVTSSLVRGLSSLGVDFVLNPAYLGCRSFDVCIVLADVAAVCQMINYKEQRCIGALLVGPNVFNWPSQFPEIANSPSVDRILVPSQWALKNYAQDMPSITARIAIWPAGMPIKELPVREGRGSKEILIYDKRDAFNDWSPAISGYVDYLAYAGYKINLITYGRYTLQQYVEALERSCCVIYFSKWESQGIALQEAWERAVPTFVYADPEIERLFDGDRSIFAPYLNEKCGALFSSLTELKNCLDALPSSAFDPRRRAEALSDEESSRIVLKIAADVLAASA